MGSKLCSLIRLSWPEEISEALSLDHSLISKDLVKSLHHLIVPHTLNIVLDMLQAELRLQEQMDSFVGQQLLGVEGVG